MEKMHLTYEAMVAAFRAILARDGELCVCISGTNVRVVPQESIGIVMQDDTTDVESLVTKSYPIKRLPEVVWQKRQNKRCGKCDGKGEIWRNGKPERCKCVKFEQVGND